MVQSDKISSSTTSRVAGPASHVYFSQRLRLHYVDWGNEEKPALLLIHGGRDHCRNWDWVAEALRDDYHVVAPDLRGHGDSQWVYGSGYAMIDYVYDIAQLVTQKHLEPVTIVGHSLGGSVALEYAGVYPDKVAKVVAIEGLGPRREQVAEMGGKPAPQRMQEWIKQTHGFAGRVPRSYPTVDDAVERMHEANAHLTEEQARHGGQREFDMGPTVVVETAHGLTVQLTHRRVAPFSLNQITSCGLEPRSFQILVAKGVNAPVAAYAPVCRTFIRVNTPGATAADMHRFDYAFRRRPFFPLEAIPRQWSIVHGHAGGRA